MYYHTLILSPDVEKFCINMWGGKDEGVPEWQRTLLKFAWPALRKFLIFVLEITPQNSEKGLKYTKSVLKEIDGLLADGRKYLLNTEEPTFVDVTFATMTAFLAVPDNYGGGALVGESKFVTSLYSAEGQKEAKWFRNTPSGKFALKLYKEFR